MPYGDDYVYDAIDHFTKMQKIAYVHFRNVRGKLPRYYEEFIDSGDVDMMRALTLYRDNGFAGLNHSGPRAHHARQGAVDHGRRLHDRLHARPVPRPAHRSRGLREEEKHVYGVGRLHAGASRAPFRSSPRCAPRAASRA